MSNLRDKRQVLGDERRAAIKAAVAHAHANAITQPAAFSGRWNVADRGQYSDGYGQVQSISGFLSRSDHPDAAQK
jgi:hypothetical protein